MNRYTIFADIAGRVALATTGSDRVTAAAVAVDTSRVDALRANLPDHLPKWGQCSSRDANAVVQFLAKETAAFSAVTVYKDTDAWRQFWKDSQPLYDAIVAQDRRGAGFVKPANVATYWLFGYAFALATAHAIRLGDSQRILDHRGREAIERTIVCDTDICGDENIEVFKMMWDRHDGSQPLMEKMGLRFYTRDVQVVTEGKEPLLLLADYLAGITHTAFVAVPGRIPMPVTTEAAKKLLEKLNSSGKTVIHSKAFDLVYRDIFGDVLRHVEAARAN